MRKSAIKVWLLSMFMSACTAQVFAAIKLVNLKTNYQETPLGIDTQIPQFSWQMEAKDGRRGYVQKRYQLVVRDEKNKVVWNSWPVPSGIAHAVQYNGEPLKPTTRYHWTITVWDNFGQSASSTSWFETGLLDSREEAWSGAQWIGSGLQEISLYSPYLSVFRLQFSIRLDQANGSTKAAFLFGANDLRLMHKHLNLMGSENKNNTSYVAIELDLSGLGPDTSSRARLNIYRVGYAMSDRAKIPFKSIIIPRHIIDETNKYANHLITTECNFGVFEFFINGQDQKHKIADESMTPTSRFAPRGLNLNPVGAGNNFISFPMLASLGFRTGLNQRAFFSDLRVMNYRHPGNDLFNLHLNPTYQKLIVANSAVEYHDGVFVVPVNSLVTADPSQHASVMLRTKFTTEQKTVSQARLYVTARGIYEININGLRVGQDFFNPGLTQYNKHHMYQTYDVTKHLQSGSNVLGAWLSEGWWSGNITYSGENWNYFGDRQALLAMMVIRYADGSEKTLVTNDRDWKIFLDGPLRYGSFFQGEVYDARLEKNIQGWHTPTYNDQSWKKAEVMPLDGSAFKGTFRDPLGRTSTLSYDDFRLIGQWGENAHIVDTLTAISVTEVRPQVFVYDLGQNLVGIPFLRIRDGKPGQRLILRFAEVKYPELPAYQGHQGMVMMENIRAALAQDIYILKGGDEIIQPRFTFHGYRYMEITGLDQALPVEMVQALVISSVHRITSSFSTSDSLVNKLWQNITWSLKGNFLSIPTDCPNRNERMGWSGDISVFARSANYLTDANQFLRRHLLAMRDLQNSEGRFPDVAPVGGGFGGILWGSAGITVAWETYRFYGDIQLLREHYEAMKKYIQFLESRVDKSTGIVNEGPLGDWLSPEGNKNDNTLFWMAYFAYDLELVGRVADILGYVEEAKKFQQRSDEIKRLFNTIYVDQATHKTIRSSLRTGFMGPPGQPAGAQNSDQGVEIHTQASYAIPLALGTFNKENQPFAVQYLKEVVTRKNTDDGGALRPPFSLMTGFIGTGAICEALSVHGASDLAYRLLTQRQYPSWLYSVVNGATTIWERLNSYTVENGFGGNNSMNSFNHYSFGAIAAWMYQYSLGIQSAPNTPAFKEFILTPTPDGSGQLHHAEGAVETMYGTIRSAWKNLVTKTIYTIEIPANTTAKLYLTAGSMANIKENGKSVTKWSGISWNNGQALIPLSSGRYVFEVLK